MTLVKCRLFYSMLCVVFLNVFRLNVVILSVVRLLLCYLYLCHSHYDTLAKKLECLAL
jgi:hypothetical protein